MKRAAKRAPNRVLVAIAAILLLALATAGVAGWWVALRPLELPESPLDFTITPGGARSAAQQVQAAGIPVQPWLFVLVARATGQDTRIKAGSYELESGTTLLQLMRRLARGDVSQEEVLLVEGWTFRQMRDALARSEAVVVSPLSDLELMRSIDPRESWPEGWFHPDTYLFAKGTKERELLARAYRQQRKLLDTQWAARAPDLPYEQPYDALVLASIIEKETGRAEDRARVAGVFVNRLKAGMLLQTDPTVIYGLGERFDGNLRKRDLLRDTPYNTYTRPGLPPTPISMPGTASMVAALNPERHGFLYFVSRGDGTSEFSANLNDHNRAVNRYQRGK